MRKYYFLSSNKFIDSSLQSEVKNKLRFDQVFDIRGVHGQLSNESKIFLLNNAN